MKIYKDFNYGLGILPTSVFMDCYSQNLYEEDLEDPLKIIGPTTVFTFNPDKSINLDNLYSEITEYRINDIVVYNWNNSIDTLKWLIPRLISERNFISIVYKWYELPELPANRIICFLDIENTKTKRDWNLHLYTENDILILYNSPTITHLFNILKILMDSKFKGKVMLHNNDWDSFSLLSNDIDYIYRYEGKILQ